MIVGNLLYKAASLDSIKLIQKGEYYFPSLHGIREGNDTLAFCPLSFCLSFFIVSHYHDGTTTFEWRQV